MQIRFDRRGYNEKYDIFETQYMADKATQKNLITDIYNPETGKVIGTNKYKRMINQVKVEENKYWKVSYKLYEIKLPT